MIAPLIRWEHSHDWLVSEYEKRGSIASIERTVNVSLDSDQWKYLNGHDIGGRILFPASAYVVRTLPIYV